MGTPLAFSPVKLVCSLLAADLSWLARGREAVEKRFGRIDLASAPTPFRFSSYYEKELGPGPVRQYVSFERSVLPSALAAIKLATNRMEKMLSEGGIRRVNLDPGYLDLSKLVLASTKDASYRVCLGRGISAQATLSFRQGSFRPWEFTYESYRDPVSIDFFNRVRALYRRGIKDSPEH